MQILEGQRCGAHDSILRRLPFELGHRQIGLIEETVALRQCSARPIAQEVAAVASRAPLRDTIREREGQQRTDVRIIPCRVDSKIACGDVARQATHEIGRVLLDASHAVAIGTHSKG